MRKGTGVVAACGHGTRHVATAPSPRRSWMNGAGTVIWATCGGPATAVGPTGWSRSSASTMADGTTWTRGWAPWLICSARSWSVATTTPPLTLPEKHSLFAMAGLGRRAARPAREVPGLPGGLLAWRRGRPGALLLQDPRQGEPRAVVHGLRRALHSEAGAPALSFSNLDSRFRGAPWWELVLLGPWSPWMETNSSGASRTRCSPSHSRPRSQIRLVRSARK